VFGVLGLLIGGEGLGEEAGLRERLVMAGLMAGAGAGVGLKLWSARDDD
jgi:hypothetical protein